MADFFDINFNLLNENLINPLHQAEENMDFINSISESLQYLRDKLFDEYRLGSTAPYYSGATNYPARYKVIFDDNSVYESKVSTIGVSPTGDTLSDTNWKLVQKSFIGSDERSKYTGQLISLCYSINKWYRVTSAPYIYLESNLAAGVGFTIYVPNALYLTLGATNTDRDNNIYGYFTPYFPIGLTNFIITY